MDTCGGESNAIRVLLWDIDNTLLDFPAAEAAAVRNLFAEFGYGECPDEMMRDYSAINLAHWERLERGEITRHQVLEGRFVVFFQKYGIPTDRVAAFNERYQDCLGDTICFLDEGDRIVRSLAGRVMQCVTTNGTRKAQEKKLRRSGLEEVFDRIFISEDIGIEKPQAGFFDHVLREADRWLAEHEAGLAASGAGYRGPLKRHEVMIIGDSLTSDIRGGDNARIVTCWYNPTGRENDQGVRVDHEIKDLREIPAILKGHTTQEACEE